MAGRAPMLWIWYWVAVAMVQFSWVTLMAARITEGVATMLPQPVQPARGGAECVYLDQLFLAGKYQGTINLGSNISLTAAGPSDLFVAQIDLDGRPISALSGGGSGDDTSNSVAENS